MTVVVYKNGKIVSDSIVVQGTDRVGNCEKIKKIVGVDGKEYLAGGAGNFSNTIQFFEHIQRYANKQADISFIDFPQKEDAEGGFDGFFVCSENHNLIYAFTHKGSIAKIKTEFFQIGCGGDLAQGAVMAGKTLEEAVKMAIEIDVYCGGEILVEEFSNLTPFK